MNGQTQTHLRRFSLSGLCHSHAAQLPASTSLCSTNPSRISWLILGEGRVACFSGHMELPVGKTRWMAKYKKRLFSRLCMKSFRLLQFRSDWIVRKTPSAYSLTVYRRNIGDMPCYTLEAPYTTDWKPGQGNTQELFSRKNSP